MVKYVTIFIALLIACVVAGVEVSEMCDSMKSVGLQSDADAYVRKESFKLTTSTDKFLYTRTEKAEHNYR